MKRLLVLLFLGVLSSCSSLVVPGEGVPVAGAEQAKAVLERSAEASGQAWTRYREVKVRYDGEWTGIVKRLQPDLVDPDFRKSSDEVYRTDRETVSQLHRGPGGTKRVMRSRDAVTVSYNGQSGSDLERSVRDAAALVADAYTAFLFGSSWLVEKGRNLELLETEVLDGQICDLVQGTLQPGFGFSEKDRFIAWIGRDDGRLHRLQFTIEGMESTRGADVEVRFLDHWQAADGSVWPGRFIEWVERPVHVKAHDWRMEGLEVDGRSLR